MMTQRVISPSSVENNLKRWSVPAAGRHTCLIRPRTAPQIHHRRQAGLRAAQRACRRSCRFKAASPEHVDLQTEEAAEQVRADRWIRLCTLHMMSTRDGHAGVQQWAGGRRCSLL